MADKPQSNGPDADDSGRRDGDTLAERIARARNSRPAQRAARSVRQNEMTGLGRAMRFASEFVAAIIIGAVIGYAIDAWLHTSPWGMIVLLLMGFAAGVLNMIRAAADMNARPIVPDKAEPGSNDDE